MSEAEQYYREIGAGIAEAEISQMFGKPCLKINGKAFVCFFQDAMVFKLGGEVHREALSLDGAVLFDPSGKNRPMKEWVQVPVAYHENWESWARAALDYVRSKN